MKSWKTAPTLTTAELIRQLAQQKKNEARALGATKCSLKGFTIFENGVCSYLDGDGWHVEKHHEPAKQMLGDPAKLISGATVYLIQAATTKQDKEIVLPINVAHPSVPILRKLKVQAWLELEFQEQGVNPDFDGTQVSSYLLFKPKVGKIFLREARK